MIPKQNAPVCDACNKPIDLAAGIISFVPLRGGLTLTVNNGTGAASKDLTAQVDLCDETCLAEYVKNIRDSIKAPAAPAPAAK